VVHPTEGAFSRDAVQPLRGACPTLPARSQDNRLLRRGHDVIAKPKRSAPDYWPQPVQRWHARIRQIVETVHNRLLATFGLEHEQPHDLAGFRTRLATKVGLHTFCLWLNVHLGRSRT
jgi:hypothetical protein